MHVPEKIRQHLLVIVLVLCYIIIDMVCTFNEIYVINLLPVVVLIVYMVFARIVLVYFFVIICTPLSIQLLEFIPSTPIDFAIPTEPLVFGMMILMIYRSFQKGFLNGRIINHPVSYAVFFYLFWIFVTSITSSMPLVSFKFLLARIWLLSVFYFLAIMLFRKERNITAFILCYSIPMLIVIVYAISRHLTFGLYDKQAAHTVMNPFFRDHTSYGAILAMLFFALAGIIINRKRGLLYQFLLWGVWGIITLALILSYTRAAWLSVIFSLFILVLVMLRIRLGYVLAGAILILVYVTGQRAIIIHKMERNRQTSSASLSEHVKSISNITTDESNLERLNRWNSALRMFRERPVFGWGPGTYMFKYAPFQRSYEKTAISTDLGNLGNAHSEYIGPLAESGLIGSISFLVICCVTLITGFRVYNRLKEKNLKQIVLFCLLGYITYLIHGTLNNFLDTDKASSLFWGFTAIFVSLDISLKEFDAQN